MRVCACNNNNEYLEHLTRTGPKQAHVCVYVYVCACVGERGIRVSEWVFLIVFHYPLPDLCGVSCLASLQEVRYYGRGNKHRVVVVDCGIKHNMIRNLVKVRV